MLSERTVELAKRRMRLLDQIEAVRVELADAIREDIAAGARQVEVVKATGYTREHIRQIVKSG